MGLALLSAGRVTLACEDKVHDMRTLPGWYAQNRIRSLDWVGRAQNRVRMALHWMRESRILRRRERGQSSLETVFTYRCGSARSLLALTSH